MAHPSTTSTARSMAARRTACDWTHGRVVIANHILSLIILGLALGVDSFRVSFGLSALKPNPARQFQWVLAFGVFDAVTPLAGFLLGHAGLGLIGPQIGYLGPICFIMYGIYTLCFAHTRQNEENDRWLILGLPMSFSLDNLVAGAGLGLLAYPPVVSAMILGLMSSVLAWLGLRMGALLVHKLALRAERITGAIFIVVAISLFIDQS